MYVCVMARCVRVYKDYMHVCSVLIVSSTGAKADLFTGVLQDGYGPPGGFCFDIYCGDSDIKVHFPV